MELNKQAYDEYVKQITPTNSLGTDMLRAFLTGGTICLLGQFMTMGMMNWCGMEKETAQTWTLLELILLSVLLTGFNIYPRIVKWGGAGALVPITGFANSVVAPALEFKREGIIPGTCAKMFTIAGPVIVFGTLASAIYGVILILLQSV